MEEEEEYKQYCKKCGKKYITSDIEEQLCDTCEYQTENEIANELEQVRYQQGLMGDDLDNEQQGILEDMGIEDDPHYDEDDIYEMFSESEEEYGED